MMTECYSKVDLQTGEKQSALKKVRGCVIQVFMQKELCAIQDATQKFLSYISEMI